MDPIFEKEGDKPDTVPRGDKPDTVPRGFTQPKKSESYQLDKTTRKTNLEIDHIRTIIFAALGVDSLFYVFSIKSLRVPIYRYNIFSNKYLVLAVILGLSAIVAAVYAPILNTFLKTVPLSLPQVGLVILLGIVNIILVETAKWWFIHRENKVETKPA